MQVVIVATLCVAACIYIGTAWLSRVPIYYSSHEHPEQSGHIHVHHHSDDDDHGHWHFGFSNITHSHEHYHNHVHRLVELPDNYRKLTEVGHLHRGENIFVYWAEFTLVDRPKSDTRLLMHLFGGTGKKLNSIGSVESVSSAKIFNDDNAHCDLEFTWNGEAFEATIPSKFEFTDTSRISIDISIDGETFHLKALINR